MEIIMLIDKTVVVSCYLDSAAFLIMLLLLLSAWFRRNRNEPMRIFYLLSLSLTVSCICSFICHAMYRKPAPWCHVLAIACRTLWEWLVLLSIFLWAAYVQKKLYGEKKLLSSEQMLYILPFGVFTILLIINLFTGIIFTYSADNLCVTSWLYDFIMLIETIWFLASLFKVRFYDKKATKIRFLRVLPMLLPVELGVVVQFFLPYQADVLGFAIGALLVFFSMADENRFLDEESGMYNRGFLAFLFDLALAGRSDVRSVLILEVDGNLPAGFEILRDTLHQTGDVIRMEKRKFMMFSGTTSRSELQLLTTHVEEAVGKHNTEHPEEMVRMTLHSRMRGSDEDAFSFLRSTVEVKDNGDPVRGVVSMISELDRLDNELKLAADIQISMLPMKFPPFPERNEFDLYATMHPAKEVGGDFYDFFLIDSDHLALVIADVSGKGIPASLFMMISKTLIKNQLSGGLDPAAALEHVNLQLFEHNSSMMFVTVWTAVLEISTGKGLACNAGHENPGIRREGGAFELLKYKHSTAAGISEKAKYQNREFQMYPGDCLFVYTDGVPEAANDAGEMFGGERLCASLNQNPAAGPEELIGQVRDDVSRFVDSAPQFDDITMLCLKYYGTRAQKDPDPAADQRREDRPESS